MDKISGEGQNNNNGNVIDYRRKLYEKMQNQMKKVNDSESRPSEELEQSDQKKLQEQLSEKSTINESADKKGKRRE